jgi:hypothetical protein
MGMRMMNNRIGQVFIYFNEINIQFLFAEFSDKRTDSIRSQQSNLLKPEPKTTENAALSLAMAKKVERFLEDPDQKELLLDQIYRTSAVKLHYNIVTIQNVLDQTNVAQTTMSSANCEERKRHNRTEEGLNEAKIKQSF